MPKGVYVRTKPKVQHPKRVRPTVEERFWRKVTKTDSCWLWTGTLGKGGYAHIWDTDKEVYVHRYSYALANGPIPMGVDILHSCDVANCVNPEHLRAGTDADNVRDRVTRGRSSMGAAHPRAVLTENTVRSIRLLASCGRTKKSIAAEFGITTSHVTSLLNGSTWKHL